MSGFSRVALFVLAGAGVVALAGVLYVGLMFAAIGPDQSPAGRWQRMAVVGSQGMIALEVLGVLAVLTALLVLCVKAVAGRPKMYDDNGRHLLIALGLAVLVVAVATMAAVFSVSGR